MFGLFKRRRKKSLDTMKVDYAAFVRSMESSMQRRSLRVFVSHRYEKDADLHDFFATKFDGFEIQDLSLDASKALQSPRSGSIDELTIKQEIAARIFQADIVIAPSNVKAGRSRWIPWEIETAAICYNIPVLFVDRRDNVQRRNHLYNRLKKLGAKVAKSTTSPEQVLTAISMIFDESILDYRDVQSEMEETRLNREPRLSNRILEENNFQAAE